MKLKESAGSKGVGNVTASKKEGEENVYTGNLSAGKGITLNPVVEINGIAPTEANKKLYNQYKKVTDTSVSYRSSDTSIATVTKKGKVTVKKNAVAGKTVSIFVSSADGESVVRFDITVK